MNRGAVSQLDRMAARLSELAEVPSRAARAVSARIEALIEEEFAGGHDPYEEPWAPLRPATLAKGRFPPPLTDTYDMRRSVAVRPLPGAGVGVTVAHPAGPHQTGWKGRQGWGPARPILPSGGGLPDSWTEAIEDETARAFRKAAK